MATDTTGQPAEVQPFPTVFWTANVTELFERAAYYSMASFVVIYLGQLGFGNYWPSFLSSSVLWFLVFFLPILSGTIADQIGFRRALLIAFVLLAVGYFFMGYPVWLGGSQLSATIARRGHRRHARRGDDRRRHRPHRHRRVGHQAVHLGHGAEDVGRAGDARLRHLLHGDQHRLAVRPRHGVRRAQRVGHRARSWRSSASWRWPPRVIVLLVRRTTKADRTQKDIWVATAGFTRHRRRVGVSWRGSTARRPPSASAPARRASPTSSRVAMLASVVAFFIVLFFYREPEATAGAGQAEAVDRPDPARHGPGAAERALLDLPDRDERLLLHLQPGLQRAAALREEGGRDQPGDGPLHRRQPVRHRLLPADPDERVRAS